MTDKIEERPHAAASVTLYWSEYYSCYRVVPKREDLIDPFDVIIEDVRNMTEVFREDIARLCEFFRYGYAESQDDQIDASTWLSKEFRTSMLRCLTSTDKVQL